MLGIDSSDDFISIGLADSKGILISRSSGPETRNKNIIHGFVQDILTESGVKMEYLNGVAIAIGPGSFTGLRVGLASAKGICWPGRLPMVGVSSLLAVAKCVQISEGKYLAIKDAKRSEFYYGGFIKNEHGIEQSIADTIGSIDEIINLMKVGYVVAGPGIDEFKKHLHSELNSIGEFNRHGLGCAIAFEGIDKLSKGETLDLSTSVPNYIRVPKPKEWKPA